MKLLRRAVRNIILEIWSMSDDFSKYGKTYITLDGSTDYPDESSFTSVLEDAGILFYV